MSLATLKEVLEIAERTNTAIPGFNIDNIEIPEAIMEAAEVENCPVILTIGQGAINAGGLRHLPDVVRRIAESSSVPVVMHLDHSESYEQVIACLRAGFTSVMYDGSHYPFEENVRESRRWYVPLTPWACLWNASWAPSPVWRTGFPTATQIWWT